jgi:hypothetical protein
MKEDTLNVVRVISSAILRSREQGKPESRLVPQKCRIEQQHDEDQTIASTSTKESRETIAAAAGTAPPY